MDAAAQKKLADHLESERAYMQDAVAGITDPQAAAKPAPDRWSVLEVLEHVTTVEYRFQGWIHNAEPIDANYDASKIEDLVTQMGNRETKRDAPEPVHPKGEYTSIQDAIAAFNTARDKTLELVAERGGSLDSVQAHHRFFGDLTGVEVLHLLAAHGSRHADQIKETRAQVAG